MEIPLTERVKFDLWVTALNAFNHPRFFATVPPRLDAIEEVTISTAGLTADAGATGARC